MGGISYENWSQAPSGKPWKFVLPKSLSKWFAISFLPPSEPTVHSLETEVTLWTNASQLNRPALPGAIHLSTVALMHLCWCLQMKTPMTLGQKKAKMIEQLLEELGVGENSKTQYTSIKGLYTTQSACAGFRPMPTEQICVQFNELRYAVTNLSSSYYLILQGPLIVLHFPGMISCSCWTWRLLVTPVSLSCSPSDTGTRVSPKRNRPRSPCQVRHQATRLQCSGSPKF